MTVVGLLLIIIAWIIQLWYLIIHNSKVMDKPFVLLYCIGVLLLVLDLLNQRLYVNAFLNTISLFLAGFVFLKLIVPQKTQIILTSSIF